MAKITKFPLLNDVTMRKKDAVLTCGRNHFDFDEVSLLQALRTGQVKSHFKQKVQYNDLKTLYFFTNAMFGGGSSFVALSIVDCNGQEIISKDIISDPSDFQFETYTYTSGAINEPTDVIAFRWQFTEGSYPEGVYYVYVKIGYSDSTTEEYLSEPIWVRTTHKNTARIDYTNDVDDNDILFRTMSIDFNYRIDTHWMKLITKGSETTYTEQDEETRRIYGKYYRAFELNIKRATEYAIDKLGRIFWDCSNLFIGDKRYLKEPDAELEYTKENNSQIGYGSIQIREYYQDRGGLFLNNSIRLFTWADTYPQLLLGFELTNDLYWAAEYTREIVDATDKTAYVAYLNSDFLPNKMHGTGEFTTVDGDLVYINGEGENFRVLYSYEPMPYWLEFTFKNITNAVDLQILWQPLHANYAGCIVYDDTTKAYKPLISPNLTSYTTTGYQFTGTGTKTVRVYNTAEMTHLSVTSQPPGQTAQITGQPTGSVHPTGNLKLFNLGFQDIAGALDLSFLSGAKNTLQTLYLYKCGITSVSEDWMKNFPGWHQLQSVSVEGNAMNQAAVDDFIIKFEQYSSYRIGGAIWIRQIPAAPPTVAADPARARLSLRLWPVYF